MAVSIQTTPDFKVGEPEELFEGYPSVYDRNRDYDLTQDDQRFLIVKRGEEPIPSQVNVVVNWAEELKQKVPTDD